MKEKLDVKSLNEYIDNRLRNDPSANTKKFTKEDSLIPWIIDELINMDFADACKPIDAIYDEFLKCHSESRRKDLNEDGDLELDDEFLAKAAGGVKLPQEDLEDNN